MALTAASNTLPDAATCSACRQIFREPVTLNCGHNFCKDCIGSFWDGKRVTCPQCQESHLCAALRINHQLGSIASQFQQLRIQQVEEKFGLCRDHQQPLELFCKEHSVFVCSVCAKSKLHGNHRVAPMEKIWKGYKQEIEALLALQIHMKAAFQVPYEDLQLEKQNVGRILDRGDQQVGQDYKDLLERVKTVQAEQMAFGKEIEKEVDEELFHLQKKRQKFNNAQMELQKKLEQTPPESLKDIKEIMIRCRAASNPKLECGFPQIKEKLWELSRRYVIIQNILRQCNDTILEKPTVEKATGMMLSPVTIGPWTLLREPSKGMTFESRKYEPIKSTLGFEETMYVMGTEGFNTGIHCWEVEIQSEEQEGWSVGIAKESVKRYEMITSEEEDDIWVLQPDSSSPLWKNEKVQLRLYLNYEAGLLEFFDVSSKELIATIREMCLYGETVFPIFTPGKPRVTFTLCF